MCGAGAERAPVHYRPTGCAACWWISPHGQCCTTGYCCWFKCTPTSPPDPDGSLSSTRGGGGQEGWQWRSMCVFVCVCVGGPLHSEGEWDWLCDNDVGNINPRSSVPIKPPVPRPPSRMQMNQYKGRAWFHRLHTHLSATPTTEGLVYCVYHIERIGGGGGTQKKNVGKKMEIMTQRNTENSRFPISHRWDGTWNMSEGLSTAKCHRAGGRRRRRRGQGREGGCRIRRRWEEMRGEALHFPLFPDSSSLWAAGGWQRERTTQRGGWLWKKVAAELPLKHLTSELSCFFFIDCSHSAGRWRGKRVTINFFTDGELFSLSWCGAPGRKVTFYIWYSWFGDERKKL